MKIIIPQKVLIITVVILIAASMIGIWLSGMFSSHPIQRVDVSLDDSPIKGNLNSSVTIVVFTDFECPFCGRFARETMPLIVSEYVDAGKARIALRNFPLASHPYAEKAAEAGLCANEQGKFWEYHDILFANQDNLGVADLNTYASQIGLNTTQFGQCLDSGKYFNQVQKDLSDGRSYGVGGTPTIFINGIGVVGALPFSDFKQVIDSELAK